MPEFTDEEKAKLSVILTEYTDEERVRQATQAHIDAGVLTLFHAFMTIHVMQNQTNKLIAYTQELEARVATLENIICEGASV